MKAEDSLVSIFQKTAWLIVRPVLKIITRREIYGLENLKNLHGPVIFAPNHASYLDAPLVCSVLPFHFLPIFFVALENFFQNHHPLGYLIKPLGAFPVKRGLNDLTLVLEHPLKLLTKGHCLCIFPEGQRTRDGNFQQGKRGVAFLALRAGCPVVPVAIRGTCRFLKKMPKVKIYFGQPLLINQGESLEFFSNRVMSMIQELYGQL